MNSSTQDPPSENGVARISKSVDRSVRRHVEMSRIVVPVGWNVRTGELTAAERKEEEERIASLADSIRENGLWNPPCAVEAVDPESGETRYGLTAGYRRWRALTEVLRVKGTIELTIQTFRKAYGPALMNVAENTQRLDVRSADLAKRLYELAVGEYPVVDATRKDHYEAVPIAEIAEATGKSPSYVRSLVRAWKHGSLVLREAWRLHDVPTDLVCAWARLAEDEQMVKLGAWMKKREAAEASQERVSRKEESDDEDDAKPRPPSPTTILRKLDEFREKLKDGPVLKGREVDVAEARIETLEWALGERKRISFV